MPRTIALQLYNGACEQYCGVRCRALDDHKGEKRALVASPPDAGLKSGTGHARTSDDAGFGLGLVRSLYSQANWIERPASGTDPRRRTQPRAQPWRL